MKQVPIKLGPAAVLLTVIAICMTVLAILALSTAGADRTMATMFADSTQIRYSLETEGQSFLQEADEFLAAGGKLTDLPDTTKAENGPKGSVEKILTKGDYHLTIHLEPAGARDYQVTEWALDKNWEEKQDLHVWRPSRRRPYLQCRGAPPIRNRGAPAVSLRYRQDQGLHRKNEVGKG